MKEKKFTVNDFITCKRSGRRIVMLTAYDAVTGRILDQAGVDSILVGDSLANCVLGYTTTLPVEMADMIRHTAAVVRGVKRAFVVADMPFMSYQVSDERAVEAAGRLVKEGGAQAVKLEGGSEYAVTAEKIVRAGIPVMGHIGLIPQSVHRMGGYRVQGKGFHGAKELYESALKLEDAGVFSIVLEGIPRQLAQAISERLLVPTIGIGAGPCCDGQILVINDVIGLTETACPKFVRRYAEVGSSIKEAVKHYARDVREEKFPVPKESYTLSKTVWNQIKKYLKGRK